MFAVDYNNLEMAKTLLRFRADTNLDNRNNTRPLHWVRSEKMAQLLFRYGANVNIVDRMGRRPLHYCVALTPPFANGLAITRFLIQKAADINAQDRRGRTPLHFVKTKEMAQVLIENGAVVNVMFNPSALCLRKKFTPSVTSFNQVWS